MRKLLFTALACAYTCFGQQDLLQNPALVKGHPPALLDRPNAFSGTQTPSAPNQYWSGTAAYPWAGVDAYLGLFGQTFTSGNRYFVASNWTTAANTSLQYIPGLGITLPAYTALNVPFHCYLAYSQATANAANAFGIVASIASTNIMAMGRVNLSTTTYTSGTLATLNTGIATNVVTFTPTATVGTILQADISGMIENPGTIAANTINILVSTGTSGDAITLYRGGFCVTQ